MAVPEAAVDENHRAVFGQHNVGGAGQLLIVEPVAQAVGVQVPPNQQFRASILAPNTGHITAAGCRGMSIGHCILTQTADTKVP